MADLRNLLTPEQRERYESGVCFACGRAFTAENVHTAAGWLETKISRLCEDCWDQLMAEPDEE